MPVIDARDIIAFPGGDNSTDTVIGNVHFNLTTLDHWNYTLYSNGTLSNGSWCLLTFPPYTPSLVLPNGTFINATWCYTPVNGIASRAGVAIGYSVLFGIALVFNIVNLSKHGRLHLAAEKRFRPIGRRWQWYWASFVCATAAVSLLTSIDVDRYYLPELPIILTSFFWFLMQIGTMALVWEAVRHWGSWMERQFIDPDPFILPPDDRRAKVEFWLPLWFYLLLWLVCYREIPPDALLANRAHPISQNFFMIIPRAWTPIQHQRYPEQTVTEAIPTATDARFKAAPFFLAGCWLTTVFSLRHSIKHYCPRNRGLLNRMRGFIRYTPPRFMLILPLAAVIPAYQAMVAWHFAYSPLNVAGDQAAIYAGGFTPTLLILYIQNIFGFLTPNEDRELQRQRRARGQAIDRELGIVRKPAWWRRVNGDYIPANESMRDRVARNVREVRGIKPTTAKPPAASGYASETVEMGPVSPPPPAALSPSSVVEAHTGRPERRRQEPTVQTAASPLFPAPGQPPAATATNGDEDPMMDAPPPPYQDTQQDGSNGTNPGSRPGNQARTATGQPTGSINQPSQQIRSMLDV